MTGFVTIAVAMTRVALLWVLVPNLSAPPWDSLEARQALLGALDRQGMVKALEPMPTRVAWGWRAEPELTAPRAARLELSRVRLNVWPSPISIDTNRLTDACPMLKRSHSHGVAARPSR